MEFISKKLQDSIDTKQNIIKNQRLLNNIQKVADLVIQAIKNGNKVLFCGNGGSAADAQHRRRSCPRRPGRHRRGCSPCRD